MLLSVPLGVKVRVKTSGWPLSAPWTAPVLAPDTAVTEPLRGEKEVRENVPEGLPEEAPEKLPLMAVEEVIVPCAVSVTTDPLLGPPGSA